MEKTIQKRIVAVFSAVTLSACTLTGTSLKEAKAECLNSVTISDLLP